MNVQMSVSPVMDWPSMRYPTSPQPSLENLMQFQTMKESPDQTLNKHDILNHAALMFPILLFT